MTRLRPSIAADLGSLATLMSHAFGGSREETAGFLGRVDPTWIQVLGEPPEGCAVLIPMSQWFGGRRVSMIGVQAVAVAPHRRGSGVALDLMRQSLQGIASRGTALSCLFASVQSLYRKVGFEHAGVGAECRLSLRTLPRRGIDRDGTHDDGQIVPIETVPAGDMSHERIPSPAVRACHASFASRFDGNVDRCEYSWRRVCRNRGVDFDCYGLPSRDGAGIDGYVFLAARRNESFTEWNLQISDLAFADADAGRALLRFIAGYAPTMRTATFAAAPAHPLLVLLAQQWYELTWRDTWMLRITDLPAAIGQRGYARGVDAAFTLRFDDELLPAHAGDWIIEVSGGEGRARRPTRLEDAPLLRSGPRGLAAIFSGHLSPRQATLVGLLDGDESALDAATAIFAGPAPWMADRF
ncbi:MAG: GNAT family N-acetyltransferase [Phycisphaerales bacterium]|jgi:predicted acetyltransferase